MISLFEFVSICGVATLTAAGASHGLSLLRRSRSEDSDNQIRSRGNEESGRPASGSWHEPRYGKRYTVSCRIEYVLGTNRYEGILIDVSRRGWRARGNQPVANGTAMPVEIFFPDIERGLMIDEVVVQWTDGLEFGVELTRISAESGSILSDYLSAHFPVETTGASALSPFSYN